MDSVRVVIAAEDDILARTLSWLLKEQGHEAVVARGSDDVLDALRAEPSDLLIIDATVDAERGHALLERVTSEERWRDVPVLVLSGLPHGDEAARLLGLGATDFLSKPFQVRDLLTRVRVQLRVRRALLHARSALQSTEVELARAREEAESRRALVDILREVTGDFSAEELYHILVRRVARALDITHCSLILARAGDEVGVVAAAYETPGLRHLEILLGRYPEIRAALERGEPVLIEDIDASPLYDVIRSEWAATGTEVPFRSVIALPFRLDGEQAGVVFLRTLRDEAPLGSPDVEFADTVVRAAVSAIRRAHAIEATKRDKARLETLALTDPLTQAYNRRALMERLLGELERARRYATTVSVLMIDLDHFKAVNDTYGHLTGDEVLRSVARVLQREARTVDVVARYGGEEFVVILPETACEGAVAVAERIRTRIAEAPPMQGADYEWLRVTVSIGVAMVPSPDTRSPEDIIALADEALYRAKAQGRNRVCA